MTLPTPDPALTSTNAPRSRHPSLRGVKESVASGAVSSEPQGAIVGDGLGDLRLILGMWQGPSDDKAAKRAEYERWARNYARQLARKVENPERRQNLARIIATQDIGRVLQIIAELDDEQRRTVERLMQPAPGDAA